jgi:uncharacterized NAD-dependent epimerase/dehydratase family protein
MDINKEAQKSKAVILTNGLLTSPFGKTAHGLIRGSERFHILAVVDPPNAGRDAGELLDGRRREIPVIADLDAALDNGLPKPDYAVIGVALAGGMLPQEWRLLLLGALKRGISVINGLHNHLNDDPEFRAAASGNGAKLIDIRKPAPLDQLHFWSGEIYTVKTPRIAVLGVDCAVGKRTTCRMVLQMCRDKGIRTEMVYTGQTGLLQGYRHGFIFDATPNDFVSGEVERVIVACDRDTNPDLILMEGQSGLRNPSGPCGSELLLSGNIKGVILQYTPFRGFFEGLEEHGQRHPTVEDEIDLIGKYGAKTLAVTLNDEGGTESELMEYQKMLQSKLDIPVNDPLRQGVADLLPPIQEFMRQGS